MLQPDNRSESYSPPTEEFVVVNDRPVPPQGSRAWMIQRRRFQISLLEFGKQAFELFQGVPYVHGKHIEVLTKYLEALAKKKIKNLLVGIPPSHSKSSWLNVILPVWVWTNNPKARFACYCYDETLGKRDHFACRDLIKSSWFQHYFPEVQLKFGSINSEQFELESGGWRLRSQPGAGMSTGLHPDYKLIDDPCNREMAESKANRESLSRWFFETMPTRGIGRDAVTALSMQPFHVDDVSQEVVRQHKNMLAQYGESPWHQVFLPLRYDPEHPMVDTGYGGDWRSEEGELLWPEFVDETKAVSLERALGPHASQAQLQLQPKRRDGAVFKLSCILDIGPDNPLPDPDQFDCVVRAWDRAATPAEDNPNACYTAGVLLGRVGKRKFYVLDVWRKQIGWEDVEATIEMICKIDEERYGYDKLKTYFEREPGSAGKQVAEILIERLRGHRIYAASTKGRNKIARADGVTTAISRREVTVVRAPWFGDFMEELSAFGRSSNQLDMDQGDALALAYNEMVNPSEKDDSISTPDPNAKPSEVRSAQDRCKNPNCNRPSFTSDGYCCGCCREAVISKSKDEVVHELLCNGLYRDWFVRQKSGG